MNNKISFLLLCLLIPALNACLDSEEYDFDKLAGVHVNPSFAIPLVQGDLSIEDLLNNNDSATLAVRDDQVLYFQYQKQFSSNSINEMLVLPDVSSTKQLVLPADVTVAANSEKQIIPDVQYNFSLSAEAGELRSLLYSAGQLAYEISSTMNVQLEVNITLPTVTKAGAALAESFNLNPGTGMQAAGASNLQGFKADLTATSPAYNTLPVVLSVTAINNNTFDVTLNKGESVDAMISFTDQEYKLVTGFFGDIEHNYPNIQLPIGPYNDMLKYDAHLGEMDLLMTVSNGYGVPINISFPVFEAVNESGDVMNIITDPADGILIESAESPGTAVATEFNIQNEVDVANFNPVEIRYNVNAHFNKGLTTADNFASDESRLSFELSAEIPLIGSFKEIVIDDTLDVSLGEDLGDTDIKRLSLRTNLTNEFPFSGNFQIYTLNSAQQITDSLLIDTQTDIITASEVTADGDLAAPGEYSEDIEIVNEKFDKLINASQLIIKARLATVHDENDNYPDVKFKANYTITVNLGVLAEFETTIEP